MDKDKDRFVIAVGPGTPQTVASDLSEALSRRREGSGPATTPANLKAALAKFSRLLKAAWKKFYGVEPTDGEIGQILDKVVVARFDFQAADLELGARCVTFPAARSLVNGRAIKCVNIFKEDDTRRRPGPRSY